MSTGATAAQPLPAAPRRASSTRSSSNFDDNASTLSSTSSTTPPARRRTGSAAMVGLRFSHPPSSVVSEPTVREEEADNADVSRASAGNSGNDDTASGPMAVPDFIAHVMHSRAAISVGEFLARVRDHGDRVGQWLIPRVQLGHLLSVATEQGSIDELVDCDALAALFLNHVHPVPGGGAAEEVGLDGDDAVMYGDGGDNESAISSASTTTSSCSSSASDQSPPASMLSSSTNPYVTSPRPKDANLSPADADAGRRPRTTSSRIAHAISLRSTSARRMASTSRVRRAVSRDRAASPDGSSSASKKKSKKKSRKSHRASDPPTNDPSLVSFNSSADPFDLNGTDLDFVVTPPMPSTPRRLTSSQYSSTPPSPAPSSVRSHSFPEPHSPQHRHHHHHTHHRSTTRAARLAALDPAVLVQQLQEYEAHFAAVRDQNAQLKAREDQHLQALAEYEAKLQEMAHDRRNLAITLSTARRTAAEAENSLFDIACERDAAMEAQAAAEAQVAQWRRANAELKAHLEVALQRMDAYKAQLENVHGALDEARMVEAQLRDEVEHYHDQYLLGKSLADESAAAAAAAAAQPEEGSWEPIPVAIEGDARSGSRQSRGSSGSPNALPSVPPSRTVSPNRASLAVPVPMSRRASALSAISEAAAAAATDLDASHPAEHDDDALDAFDLDASAPGNRSLCFELESALAAEADAKQLEELTAQLAAAQDEVTALKAALDETATRATRAEHDRDDAAAQAASLQIQVRHWQRLAESMHPTYAQAAASRRTMGTQTPTSTAAKQTVVDAGEWASVMQSLHAHRTQAQRLAGEKRQLETALARAQQDVEAAQHEIAQLRSVNRHQQELFKVEHDTLPPLAAVSEGIVPLEQQPAELIPDSNAGKKSKRKKKKGKSSAAKQQANKSPATTTTKPKQREEETPTTTGSVIAPPSAPSPAPAAPASPRASRPASVVSRSSDSSVSSLSRLTALPPLTPKSPTLSTFSRRVGPDMNAPGTRRVSTLLTGLSSPPARGNGLRRRTSAAPSAVSAASVAFPPPAPLLATPRPVYKSSPTSSAASTAPPASTSSTSLASLMSDLDLESDGGHSGNPKRLRIRSIARGFLAAVVLNIGFLVMLVLTSAGLWNPAAVGGRRGLPAAEWRRAPAMVGGVGAGAAAAAVAVGATRAGGGAWRRQ